ncbi:hypothetical protein GCM10010502_19230 [Kitasatospora aureofaciens]|uniref:Uncharacterized protein n=1 Tax=Kitasatospora aureofaciens TaxID=1894 RepID=A0A8H9HIL1_KITAU|nr:hypothetical protein GCM10010502_19230 [Kitasatospora aureofaciens]
MCLVLCPIELAAALAHGTPGTRTRNRKIRSNPRLRTGHSEAQLPPEIKGGGGVSRT